MARGVVRNLDEVQRAFVRAGQTLATEKTLALRAIAVPVEMQAELLARQRIRRIGNVWWQMRVGYSAHSVYVAPVKRGTKDKRKQRTRFADVMMARAMKPALDANLARAEREMDKVLTKMERSFG